MIRNLKALGLALVAVFAMSAMAASGAQAEGQAVVTLGASEGTIDATQIGTGTFTRAGLNVKCEKGEFVAHVKSGDTTITTTEPKFENCTGPLSKPATVKMTGCDFHFDGLTGEKIEGKEPDTFTITKTSLKCPENVEAHIEVYNNAAHTELLCSYTFQGKAGVNENLKNIDLTNEPAGGTTPKDWIKAHINIINIVSKRTFGSALVCGAENNATGSLTGTWELKGTDNNKNSVDLTVSTGV